ncbi:MAG: AraC family transcriptional regulator [Pseudomonadales bacterium]|nr:AraC family transcriptional regulator [Pseudomonadales bacterium]
MINKKNQGYLASVYVQAILELLQELEIASEAELMPWYQRLTRQGRYVDEEFLVELLRQFEQRLDYSDFFIRLGKRLRLEVHGFLGYAAKSSDTLHEALMMDVLYLRTQLSFVDFNLSIHGDLAELTFEFRGFAAKHARYFYECILASLNTMSQQLSPEGFQGVIHCDYDQPSSTELINLAKDSQVLFSQDENKIVFPLAFLQSKISSSDEYLKALSKEQCESMLVALPKNESVSEQVRYLIERDLAKPIGLSELAQALHLSESSLKRRLSSEGTSFRKIHEHSKEAKAKALLKDRIESIDQVALQVGYAETAAFNKAFKRWTGMSPREFLDDY